jgi:hypothetical protein
MPKLKQETKGVKRKKKQTVSEVLVLRGNLVYVSKDLFVNLSEGNPSSFAHGLGHL